MKTYKTIITLNKNDRGIWDLDTSKGCSSGLQNDKRGCYGDCYAARSAKIYGIDFSKTVLRDFKSVAHQRQIIKKINKIPASFIRLGCSGDPSENWQHTLSILAKISKVNKEIVIITRHWTTLTNEQLIELNKYNLCVNTSVSALDNQEQRQNSIEQYNRIKPYCKSLLRIVSCDFNKENETGLMLSKIQDELFKNEQTIDTVFRPTKNNKFVLDGIINIKISKFLGHKSIVSKLNPKAYLGKCETCKEQCGIFKDKLRTKPSYHQLDFSL